MMDATEAGALWAGERVVPFDKLMDEALGAALIIADFSQIAVMAAKESVNRAFEGTLADGVMFERRLFHALFATQDQKKAWTPSWANAKPILCTSDFLVYNLRLRWYSSVG